MSATADVDCSGSTTTAATSQIPPYSIFSKRQKMMIVTLVSTAGLFSSLSANIYFPVLEDIQLDLHTTPALTNLTVTAYMLCQAVVPTFWCALADHWGRRPVYLITFVLYALSCAGLALSPDYASLLGLRILQAFGCSAVIGIGSGTIGDIAIPAERGGYMGAFSLGTMLGPTIGPVLGGLLAHTLNWRSVFWFLAIASFVLWVFIVFLLPETLRSLVGDGSGYAHPTPIEYIRRKFYSGQSQQRDQEQKQQQQQQMMPDAPFADPKTDVEKASVVVDAAATDAKPGRHHTVECRWVFSRMLEAFINLREKDVILTLLYNSMQYAANYCILTSLTELFSDIYQLNELQIGLCYLANGLGSISGSFMAGRILDWRFKTIAEGLGISKAHTKRGNMSPEFPLERARLGITWTWALVFNVTMILYGWLLSIKVHLAVPLLLNFIMSHCTIAIANTTTTLLVDLFPRSSATAIASSNLIKCVLGAIAVAFINPGIDLLGVGWMFTLTSGILLLSRLFLVAELRYGPQWREARRQQQSLTSTNTCI